jgi:hypothetical protein
LPVALDQTQELLVAKLRIRRPLDGEGKVLASFGFLVAVSTGLIMITAVYLWQSRALVMPDDLASGRDRRSWLACAGVEGLASAGWEG